MGAFEPVNTGRGHGGPEGSPYRTLNLTCRSLAALKACATGITATVVLLSAGLGTAAADEKADQLLAQARAAITGRKGPEGLSALQVTGTYRRVLGEREMSGDLEIALQMPDKFLRTETMSFSSDPGATVRRYFGVNGGEMIEGTSGGGGGRFVFRQGPPPGQPGPGGRELSPEEIRALQQRRAVREFARQTLALLLATPAGFQAGFAYVGEAESPDGSADVIEVTGPDDFKTRVFLDKNTHLPLMLSYEEPAPRMVMVGGPGGGAPPSQEELERRVREARTQGPPPMAENQLYLLDHTTIDGVMLPTKVRRAVNGEVSEEWELTSFKVNPAFKADKFEKK